ncbi:MAG: hypothetical protein GY795_00330 [Desulfobacterales bacterium]|nr:hypothetical protein [Desulfobacterales bacterium]
MKDAQNLKLARAIANLASIAIENTKLCEDIQKSRDEPDLRVKERTAELLKERNRFLSPEPLNIPHSYILLKSHLSVKTQPW